MTTSQAQALTAAAQALPETDPGKDEAMKQAAYARWVAGEAAPSRAANNQNKAVAAAKARRQRRRKSKAK